MGADSNPSAGDALRETQRGALPIGSVEAILKKAPSDLVKETLPIPEWDCSVKLQSLTAAQAASIKQEAISTDEDGAGQVDIAEMEIKQLQLLIQEPAFNEDQVRELYLSSGRGVAKIIAWGDAKAQIDKKELRKLRDDFRGPAESEKV